MIYGHKIDTTRLMVAAADDLTELMAFAIDAKMGRVSCVETVMPLLYELEFDPIYEGLISPPTVLIFADTNAMDRFVDSRGITLCNRVTIIDRNVKMASKAKSAIRSAKPKTIAEQLGLDKNDPWKKKEPEDDKTKIKNIRIRKQREDDDALTGDDSFDPSNAPGSIRVTGIETEIRDGKLTVVSATAQRIEGSFAQHVAMIEQAERQARDEGKIRKEDFRIFTVNMLDMGGRAVLVIFFAKKRRAVDPNSLATICDEDDLEGLLPDGMYEIGEGMYEWPGRFEKDVRKRLEDAGFIFDPTIIEIFNRKRPNNDAQKGRQLNSMAGTVFYRFDIPNGSLDDLDETWEHSERTYIDAAQGFGEEGDYVWFAFSREAIARTFANRLSARGMAVSEVYSVNAANERLIAADANATAASRVVEIKEAPRPWNRLAKELQTMSDDDLARNRAGYEGSEFIVCAIGGTIGDNWNPNLRVYIVPSVYFEQTGELYPEPLDINHILPSFLKEVSPGVYETKIVDMATLVHDLCGRRKFVESIMLQFYVNTIDK